MLFQGEEWRASTPFLYFTDHPDPELGRAVREGRRREFPVLEGATEVPDPQDPETFRRSKLDWDEVQWGEHKELLEWYRQLIALRREEPDLATGNREQVTTAFDEEARWLVVRRGRFSIAANFGDHPQSLPLECAGSLALASVPDVAVGETSDPGPVTITSSVQVRLPARSVAIVAH